MTAKQTKNYVKSSFYPLQQWAQKGDRFWFTHILSYRFNPIRSQLETVLDFWLVNVWMKACELIKRRSHSWTPCCKPQYWPTSICSWQYQYIIERKGYENTKNKINKGRMLQSLYQILLTNSCVWAKALRLSNCPDMVSGHLASKPSHHQWNRHQE